MSLFQLEPETKLEFPHAQPGTKTQTTLNITNIHATDRMVFKVKTTNPKSYLVRPSTGLINPGEVAQITIQMQGNPGQEKDRFLVQCVACHAQETAQEREERNANEKKWLKDMFSGDATAQEARLAVIFAPDGNAGAGQGNAGGMAGGFQTVHEQDQVSTAKYNQIVNYALIVEKQNQSLVKQIQDHSCASSGSNFQLWHMIVAMVLAVVLAKGLEIVF